jgi:crossover junction endodeoxyribonuclease RusA
MSKVTPTQLVVELPFPPAGLNPNQKNGKHWSSTHAAKKQYLADCFILTKQAMGNWKAPEGSFALNITFVQPDKRRRDRDNLLAAMKSGLDGISQALGIDDSNFEALTIRREYGTKPGAVRVVIKGGGE